MSQSGDVAIPVNSTDERTQMTAWGYDPDLDFRKLAQEAAYHAAGFRLVEKSELEGIPLVIIGATYREGFPRDGRVGDYVSVEAVVADKDTLNLPQFRHINQDAMTVFPNEPVVFNDSGTGIRRTLTELFNTMGLIHVGDLGKGEKGNVFDRPMQFWDGGEELAATGIHADPDGVPFRYVAIRGLRKSEYESPYGPATTFYLG
jgi:hypothetical protein